MILVEIARFLSYVLNATIFVLRTFLPTDKETLSYLNFTHTQTKVHFA